MSPTSPSTPPAASDLPIASAGHGRYQIHRLIGRGGMALVYEATDRSNQQRVALKRLQVQPDELKQKRNLELFEREFHTLSQIAHPRIVSVDDFGVDAEGPYYVMELLPGGDLQELAPLPWRRACAIARDICSALSLLHSRRFVHRDISPRNVRCTEDGPAKLIDFGAMAPFGPIKLVVGTPPCCAPESVHLQSLDGRADLFGFGATFYYMLVGRHAYPARSFRALAHVWANGVTRPSEQVPDIPPELDVLVLELLRLDPDARPASATEVMERLSAIDGEKADPQLTAASSYLTTPTLVGREDALARVRRRLRRATGGRSRSVVIEGAPGVGRTRFLDACLLDATLRGQTLVRADADDAVSGDYGVVRAIARQLFAQVPERAAGTASTHREELATLIPELRSEAAVANDTAPLPRAQLQRALHGWLTSLSKQHPFVIAVDDFHRIDEPSAALIALLERDSTEHELCLLITVESDAPWTAESARKLLAPLTTLQLEALGIDDCERLLSSVFGSVPHISLLAHRLHELCAGSPRDLLRLAQHLIDRGVVRVTDGAWTLPAEIDQRDLPGSLSDALAARIATLSDAARDLACALALCPDQSFTYEECGALCGLDEPGARLVQIETLLSADLARRSDDDLRLSGRTWLPLLLATLSAERSQLLERRLAELFERRVGQEFRAAQHWFRASAPDHALDLLVLHAQTSQEQTYHGPEIFQRYLLTLPDTWFEVFQEGLHYCDVLQRPRRHKFELLSRVVGIMAMLNTHAADLLAELFVDLRRDSGYDDWEALDPQMDPQKRLHTALSRARARYEATPERDRVVDPASAIRRLTRCVIAASGPISMALDVTTLRTLPRLRLFAGLSPALEASSQLLEGLEARCTGRFPIALSRYMALLQIVGRPDRGGIDASFAVYLKLGVSNGVGMIEAGLGLPTCTKWAAELARNPAYEVNAAMIRMLERLFQGDLPGAEEQKRLADRLRIQNSGRQMYEGGHLIWQLHAYALSGDLTRVRQTSEEIAPLAKRYPQWEPVLCYAVAEYYRMARDFKRAVAELEQVLETVKPGLHQVWPYAADAHVLTLLELKEPERALQAAETYVASAARELEYVPNVLQLSHALARAVAGQSEAALSIDALIARLQQDGIGGLHLGVAHEFRARVALQLQDHAGFARHLELCRLLFTAHQNAALTAKYHRLFQEARRAVSAGTESQRATPDSEAQYQGTRIELALAGCRDEDQRARLALTLLTAQSGASAGLLYLLRDDEPACVARLGQMPEPASLLPPLRRYLASQQESEDVTASDTGEADQEVTPAWFDADGQTLKPLLLSHYDHSAMIVTGVAVLAFDKGSHLPLPAATAASISQFFTMKNAASMMRLAD